MIGDTAEVVAGSSFVASVRGGVLTGWASKLTRLTLGLFVAWQSTAPMPVTLPPVTALPKKRPLKPLEGLG